MSSPESVKNTVPLANSGPRIAVVGAGAVGGYFGGMLARAGLPVVFIGRPGVRGCRQTERIVSRYRAVSGSA